MHKKYTNNAQTIYKQCTRIVRIYLTILDKRDKLEKTRQMENFQVSKVFEGLSLERVDKPSKKAY